MIVDRLARERCARGHPMGIGRFHILILHVPRFATIALPNTTPAMSFWTAFSLGCCFSCFGGFGPLAVHTLRFAGPHLNCSGALAIGSHRSREIPRTRRSTRGSGKPTNMALNVATAFFLALLITSMWPRMLWHALRCGCWSFNIVA